MLTAAEGLRQVGKGGNSLISGLDSLASRVSYVPKPANAGGSRCYTAQARAGRKRWMDKWDPAGFRLL